MDKLFLPATGNEYKELLSGAGVYLPFPCYHMTDSGASSPIHTPSVSAQLHPCYQVNSTMLPRLGVGHSLKWAPVGKGQGQFSPILQPARGRTSSVQPYPCCFRQQLQPHCHIPWLQLGHVPSQDTATCSRPDLWP